MAVVSRTKTAAEERVEPLLAAAQPFLRAEVRRLLRRRYALGPLDEDDCLQEVLLALWRSAERFQGQSLEEFLFWAKPIVGRIVKNCQRTLSRKRRCPESNGLKRVALSWAAHEVVSPAAPPESRLARRELEWRVRRGVERLEKQKRMAVSFVHLHDVPAAQAAEMLKTTLPSLYKRLTTASKELRVHLRPLVSED